MTKVHAKTIAIELRRAGHSYNHIAPIAGVSKSTLGVWLANITYTPNAETIARIGNARAASGAAKNKLKRESIMLAKEEALRELGKMTKRDLFMLGLGLYIGEGGKSTSMISVANSNPAVISLMIRWMTEALGLSKQNIRLCIHLYPDCNVEESLQYWSRMTTIPRSQFRKTSIDRRTDKKSVNAGKLPHGTAHLIVNSLGEKRFGVFLSRKIKAWCDKVLEIRENAGLV